MKKIEFKKLTIILMALSMMIILVFAISMTANAATTTEVLTVAELQSALDSGVVDITIPPDTTLTLTCDITIQSSVTLTIQGTIYNDGYGTIYNYGRIANSGTINNYDHSIIYNHGTIDNSGVIDNVVYSTIYNYDYGRIANSGTISAFYFGGIYNHDSGTINNTGTINIDDSTIDNVSIIYNYGRIGSSGYSAIRNYDSGIIYNAGTIDNDGTIYNAGAIDNDGIIYNSGSGPIANYGIINNYGSIDKIYNADEIRFGEIRIANSGLIYNYGTINNLGCAIRANNGLLEPIRSIIDNKGGIISNFGEINNVGSTINNNGRIDNGGIINNKNRYTADFNQAIIVIVANSDGLINNNEGGTIDNNEGGTINNDYSSRIYNNIGSTIDNLGLINNYVWGEINNYGTFYGNSVANYYLVAFDETSYLFFRYNAQIIQEGDCAKLPDGPAREGFTFEGWYANYDNVFDPTIPISGNNYFHAKWVESHVEHDWDDGVVTTIATCVENGMIYYTCKVCGETYTALIVALDHTEGEPIIAFEPACTDEGTWEIWCTVCDVLLNSGVIPPLGHVWREIVTEPTCTDWGYTTYICANDETHNYVDNYVSAHGHHFVRIPMYYPAVIPYCDVYWYYVDECVFCGETILTPFQPIYVEHYWDSGSIVIPVTCIENGEMLFRCTYCGELRTEVIIAFGHTEGGRVITLEPTCTDEGAWEINCVACDALLESGIILPLDHDCIEVVTEPTCTEWGYTTYICTNDEAHSYIDNYTPPHGHHFVSVPVVYPAVIPHCDAYWYHMDMCIFCRETISTPYSYCDDGWYHTCVLPQDPFNPSHGDDWYHTEMDVLSQDPFNALPTYVVKCMFCGETISVPPPPRSVEHYWDSGSIVIPVTCIENGEMLFRCTYCGELRTEVIIAFGHTEGGRVITLEPTCTDEGAWEINCVACDALLESGIILPLDHDWTEVVTEPSCVEPGYTTHICANDETHNYVDDYVPAANHVWGEFDYSHGRVPFADPVAKCGRCEWYDYVYSWTITKAEPTCTADGNTQYERSDGWMYWTYDEGSAMGHNFIVTDLGWGIEYKCERCNYTTYIYADKLYVALKAAQNFLNDDFSAYTEESVAIAKTWVNNNLRELEALKYFIFTGEMTQSNLDKSLSDINIDTNIEYAQSLLTATPPEPILLERFNITVAM